MLTVENLTKTINNQVILDNLSFSIEKGTVTGLVGKNGAGKTTLLKILAGIIDPEHGNIRFKEQLISLEPELKKEIIFVHDSSQHFKNYTLKELATFYTYVYPSFDKEHFYELIDQYNLPIKQNLRHFSKGMKAQSVILLAICVKPKVLLLDEPTNGLDPVIKRQILELLLQEVAENELALFISTHHLHEVEQMADQIILLENGQIDDCLLLEDLKSNYKKLQIAFDHPFPDTIRILPNIDILDETGRIVTLLIHEKCNKTLQLIKKEKPILLEELPMTLEDIFLTKFGGNTYVS